MTLVREQFYRMLANPVYWLLCLAMSSVLANIAYAMGWGRGELGATILAGAWLAMLLCVIVLALFATGVLVRELTR